MDILRPIVSSWDAVTYGIVRELTWILGPLHTIPTSGTTWTLWSKLKNIKPEKVEYIIPCDGMALFKFGHVYPLSISSRTNWNKMQNSLIEHPCPSQTSLLYWGSALRMPIFCSRVSIMTTYWKQQWVTYKPIWGQHIHGGF